MSEKISLDSSALKLQVAICLKLILTQITFWLCWHCVT